MILLLDNYDSFVHNLARYVEELGCETHVVRSDAVRVGEIQRLAPDAIILSPGPCTPTEAGVCMDVVRELGKRIPILGVCLGHQALGEAFGGRVVRAPRLMHGKTSPILHRGRGLFAGLDNPFEATRYHSLIVERETLPDVFEVMAWTPENELMGIKHKSHETWGVQFHPESILTTSGLKLIENFLTLCRQQGSARL